MDNTQNFHLPLPDSVYRRLRKEAERRRVPATALAREAVEAWLDRTHREALHTEIAQYARQQAGTNADLDVQLEGAAVEMLNSSGAVSKKPRKAGKR